MIKVLLCCGAGISSGLLASKAKKAAREINADISFEARSESEVDEYLPYIDLLYFGPHYSSLLNEYQEKSVNFNYIVNIIDTEIYGAMDGKALVNHALITFNSNK